MTEFQVTEDGIEKQFAVNYLSHFLLTKLLIPELLASAPSRVVALSSHNHRESHSSGTHLTLESLNNIPSYDWYAAYGQSKLCMNLLVQELERRLFQNVSVFANAANPGIVSTNLAIPLFEALHQRGFPWLGNALEKLLSVFGYTPEEGVLTQIYLATSPEIELYDIRGKHFDPIAQETVVHEHANNLSLQSGLWEFSELLTLEFQS